MQSTTASARIASRSLSKFGYRRWLSSALPINPATSPSRTSSVVKGRDSVPFRMAVIGSGPAGFYTAYRVLNKLQTAMVDMYEALPVPYGLVRFGVAPDHPEVKNCIDKFDEVAQSPRFNYIGNTSIGTTISLAQLKDHYDCILLSYGASKDRKLGIPGEDTIHGIYSARAFVGWYNGLPEYRSMAPNLSAGEEAVVIGQGNVALDVARVLLSDVDALRKTDITEYALEELSKSRVKRVKVVGRRGPLQASFTIKEVRELLELPKTAFKPIPDGVLPQDIKSLPRAQKRLMTILQKGSKLDISSAPKSWELGFQLSPQSFGTDSSASSSLSHIVFEKTRLETNPTTGSVKAIGTGETEKIPASLVFRSIGYKSEPIEGTDELGIPFDISKGIVHNVAGRVVVPDIVDANRNEIVPGVYTSGWVKSGPTGVIASTMIDAFDTSDLIIADWLNGTRFLQQSEGSVTGGWNALEPLMTKAGHRYVSWNDWKIIEKAERDRGKQRDKSSEKFASVDEMLNAI